MMAGAAWLVWQRGGIAAQRRALFWFILQLGLNAAWTLLFFGLHLLAIAFGEMLVLWAAIAVTVCASSGSIASAGCLSRISRG